MPTVRRAECNKRRIAFVQAASQPFVKSMTCLGWTICDRDQAFPDLRCNVRYRCGVRPRVTVNCDSESQLIDA